MAILVIILFATTSPKTIQDFGYDNKEYYRVKNYLLFTTCSASYKFGDEWRVHQIGVLGMKLKIR